MTSTRRGVAVFALVVAVAVAVCGGGGWGAAAETLAETCGKQFQNVVPCLSFATAKAAAPSKECCDSVASIKKTNPACLCYVIQQVHGGDNAQVKSMGVKEDRILELPAVCKIDGADITLCPKLLNLPANSPDAAIFTNSTAAPATTTSKTPSSSAPGLASPTTTGAASDGFKHGQQLAGVPLLASAVLILGGLWAGFSFN